MDLASVALGVLFALCVEVPVALVNRRLIRRDTNGLIDAAKSSLKDELVAELKPKPAGELRGGLDPADLLAAKAAKAEERAIAAAENKAAIIGQLTDKLGDPGAASLFWSWLEERHPDIAETAVKYRDGWRVIRPFLARFKPVSAGDARGEGSLSDLVSR